MAEKPTKSIKQESSEPSDDDLELLEDSPEDMLSGAELDNLLNDVLDEPGDETKSDQANSKIENILNMALGGDTNEELAKSLIGESVMDDDLNLDKDDQDNDSDEEEQEFEEFDEFAEDNDLGDDSNFDSTEASDPRYPEY